MNRFKYYIDFGSGWVEVNPVKNELKWSKENKINPAIYLTELSGSCLFVGFEYDNIITFKNAGNNYIPFKVEQISNVTKLATIIFSGNSNLKVKWDENRKTIEFSKFNNDLDFYGIILSNYKVKQSFRELFLAGFEVKLNTVTTFTQDAYKLVTTLSVADYQAGFDINGYFTFDKDPRWDYFLYRSTNADGSHNFETMAFDFDVGLMSTSGGIIQPAFNKISMRLPSTSTFKELWVRLPPSIGATAVATPTVAKTFNRLYEVIESLLTLATSTISFDKNSAVTYVGQSDSDGQYSFFNFDNYLFGESAQLIDDGFKGSEISLFDVFNILEKTFNLYWHLDGANLKFKHSSELTSPTILDLSEKTKDLKRVDFIVTDFPDVEEFKTKDSVDKWNPVSDYLWGTFQIMYKNLESNLSNREKLVTEMPIYTNVKYIMSKNTNTGKNNFALLEAENDSSTPRYLKDDNINLSSMNLFGHLNKRRFGDSAIHTSRFKIGVASVNDMSARPLFSLPKVFINIDILIDFDTTQIIRTAITDTYVKNISQKLNSDILELELEF